MTTQTIEHPQTYICRGNAPFMRIAVVMDLTSLALVRCSGAGSSLQRG